MQPGQKLTTQVLQLNGNLNDTRGTGGTCFGDSGGPTFLNGYVVTVTSYGYTDNCRYLGGYQRVDIQVVQDWLARFGSYPPPDPRRVRRPPRPRDEVGVSRRASSGGRRPGGR